MGVSRSLRVECVEAYDMHRCRKRGRLAALISAPFHCFACIALMSFALCLAPHPPWVHLARSPSCSATSGILWNTSRPCLYNYLLYARFGVWSRSSVTHVSTIQVSHASLIASSSVVISRSCGVATSFVLPGLVRSVGILSEHLCVESVSIKRC